MERARRGLAILGHWFAPHDCVLCGARGGRELALCAGCLSDLPRLQHPCPRCGLPLPAAGVACGHCTRQPPAIARSRIPFRYATPIDRFVQALKFDGQLDYAQLLGTLLAEHVRSDGHPLPQHLIPVPLHRRRLRQRGFNQSLEIARACARRLDLPVAVNGCRRTRDTRPQTELAGPERRRNVRGAFEIGRLPAADHVAIVDDVVTTGHTVNELAKALRRHGVATVEVWAVARA